MIKSANKNSSPPVKMAKSIRGLMGDFLTLGELQLQLFMADLRDGRTHLVRSIILLTLGATILIACFPIAMLALSYGLVDLLAIPLWAGLLISASFAFCIGAVLLWIAGRWLTKSLAFFRRSSEEFSNNLNWIKLNTKASTTSQYFNRN